jgi:subtilase family serine protease
MFFAETSSVHSVRMTRTTRLSITSIGSAASAARVGRTLLAGLFWNAVRLLCCFLPVAVAGASFAASPVRGAAQGPESPRGQVLAGHVPSWANAKNLAGAVPADLAIGQITLVLARPPEQEQAFDKLLADQQDPASPDYHHWLTPEEVGQRFGMSDEALKNVTGWLESEGLTVNWVAPGRNFVGLTGRAGDVARAFQTEFAYYQVNGEQRFSITSDPVVPAELAQTIKAIRGLSTIHERPLHRARVAKANVPGVTFGAGEYFVAPADFAKIYDIPSSLTGAGVSIGIVGEARTDFNDFSYFRSLTGSTFSNPTEIVPTNYGGVDPGPALTSPPVGNQSNGNQGEATLDVTRSGSVAPGASLLLVVATQNSGGIADDAQYLVQTSPVPVKVMTISFGACESEAGSNGVSYWDTLFKQAAGEGISVMVASGDAGAAGCDTYNAAPPANSAANSPNYICSSSYATCVGGTEFNDTSNPSLYWSSSNNQTTLESALGYIPEGAWNEPLNENNSPATTQASSTGGGVSKVIATPSWQTGTGVPTARTGRYTPDISFTAAGHDGYLACFAAGGGSCAPGADVEIFSGTSAAAPDMAGIAALLDQKKGGAQGNLNPAVYAMAASKPSAFHDVTVASSGVTNCSVNTPSICNNSVPSLSGLSGGQPGFLVGTGFDEATGWGSLDVGNFINNFSTTTTPTAATPAFSPAAGAYTSKQTVSITDSTPNSTIYYTTNGATPTTSSSKYTAGSPITVSSTEMLEAMATATGYTNSAVATAAYTITAAPAVTPTISPSSGNYPAAQMITLTDMTSGATIYYTTNGTTPSTSSTKYTAPFLVNANGTVVQAIAAATGSSNSAVASTTYTFVDSPSVLAEPATAITTSTATLNALTNTLGIAGTYLFQYGASATALTTSTGKVSIGNATSMTAVSANISGLKTKTPYYYQVVVTTPAGTSSGAVLTFTTN